MKRCAYCGSEYSDEKEKCPTDGQPLQPAGKEQTPEPTSSNPQRSVTISPQEQRFWERMTFRQFALLTLRIQAMWLLFNAVVEATYLVNYLAAWPSAFSFADLSASFKRELALAVLRIVINVAAGLALIQNAERFLSWLVKDAVSEQARSPQRTGG